MNQSPIPSFMNPATVTVDGYLEKLRAELLSRYEWAKTDDAKLSNFMRATYLTITSSSNHVNLGDSHQAAWKACGLHGKVTFRGLRELSNGL